MKKYSISKVCSASDLRAHAWVNGEAKQDDNNIKKKKSQFNLHNDGNVSVILSLKELLNVSSDWMDVKNTNKSQIGTQGPGSISTNTGGAGGSQVPSDFQSL